MLVDLYQQGRLDLDAFVTEEIGLGDVEAAFDKRTEIPIGRVSCALWSSLMACAVVHSRKPHVRAAQPPLLLYS